MDVVVSYFYEFNIPGYRRNKSEYFNRFKSWAQYLKNNMIIFVQQQNAELIKQIRRDRNTKIIILDENIDKKFVEYNDLIKNNICYSNFSNNILTSTFNHKSFEYCFVWMLKIYFIYEASKMLNENDNIIYIDFGLTELKNILFDEKDFDKLINFKNFNEEKINIFKYTKKNFDIPMFELLEYSLGYIYACVITLKCKLAKSFYYKYFEIMKACLLIGFNPVDQDILYLLQKYNKNNFNLIELKEDTTNVIKYVFDIPYKVNNVNNNIIFFKKYLKKFLHKINIIHYLCKRNKRINFLYFNNKQ